jgi:ribosomal protein L11 methyltransferase
MFGMTRSYVQVTIGAEIDAGELLGILPGAAPLGAWETQGAIHLYWREEDWNAGLLDQLTRLLRQFDAGPVPITTAPLPDCDWNLAWSRSLTPVRVGTGIVIRQSWNSYEGAPAAVELVIDPRRAFGTGYHATTQMLLEWIEQEVKRGETVLDVGTGSGILAMVALRLGARSALGIDADPEAIDCAREYATINGVAADLQLRVQSIAQTGNDRFDLVLANLDRKTLLTYTAQLCRSVARNGRLLISGLQPDDYADIAAALTAAGATRIDRRDRDEWLAMKAAGFDNPKEP